MGACDSDIDSNSYRHQVDSVYAAEKIADAVRIALLFERFYNLLVAIPADLERPSIRMRKRAGGHNWQSCS